LNWFGLASFGGEALLNRENFTILPPFTNRTSVVVTSIACFVCSGLPVFESSQGRWEDP